MLKFFSSHWNQWGPRILVTQKYINFLSHLDYSKIRLLKFLQFFKYIGIYIYLCLYGITASFASWAKFSKDFLTSPHGVAELIHMPEFLYRWKTLEATQEFITALLAFPRAKGPYTALLLLAPQSPCCLDPVRSCWKPLCKVRKMVLCWHWISPRWTAEHSAAEDKALTSAPVD